MYMSKVNFQSLNIIIMTYPSVKSAALFLTLLSFLSAYSLLGAW